MSDHSATNVRTVRLEGIKPAAAVVAVDTADGAPVLVLGDEVLGMRIARNDGAPPSDLEASQLADFLQRGVPQFRFAFQIAHARDQAGLQPLDPWLGLDAFHRLRLGLDAGP